MAVSESLISTLGCIFFSTRKKFLVLIFSFNFSFRLKEINKVSCYTFTTIRLQQSIYCQKFFWFCLKSLFYYYDLHWIKFSFIKLSQPCESIRETGNKKEPGTGLWVAGASGFRTGTRFEATQVCFQKILSTIL